MAYNLQSLITILQQLLNPEEKPWIVIHNKPQLESLLQKVASLQKILENSSCSKIESLESRIRDTTHKVEDIIECHMVDQVLSWHGGKFLAFPTPDLQSVMEEFDSAMEQVLDIVEGKKNMSTASSSNGAAILTDHRSSRIILVGVDADLMQLKDRLIRQESNLEIVPIVGMGGIGKTQIARKLYDDPLIISHFDVCAWTTISQNYDVRPVLVGLLRRPNEKLSKNLIELTDNELKDILYKRLYGRRYLVVLDDMWSTDSWNVIRRCFPDNNNGSRIMLTTRESDVAKYVGTQSLQHKVQLLNKTESWNLLHQMVFGEENCPDELQEIGRKIAHDCGGLPLAINVIGGLLSKAKRSRDVWESIAKDVSAVIAEADNGGFSNVLSLSYNHLPNHLKPCFLYMGAFPEDHEVKGSRLKYLWVAEGFLKSNGDRSLEEEAEDYLDALVERNLLLVIRKKSNGKALRYGMHDLLRDLCRRKGGEEKFVYVKNVRAEMALDKLRRVSVHTSYGLEDVYASHELILLARSFICTAPEILYPVFFVLRLLRVLDVLDMQFQYFPREILQLVNLRYLALSCKSDIPRELSRLFNLQTLIARLGRKKCRTFEIWEMSELRHLKLDALIIIKEGHMKQLNMQKKLQTISWMVCTPSVIRMGFFKTIPNIKNLGIFCSSLAYSEVVDLSHLHKLETLRCYSIFLPTLRFPCSLRKISLFQSTIFPRLMLTTLCELPNLEVLNLVSCSFENDVFEATEGDVFRSLKFLCFQMLNNMVHWRADETNFPTLRELVIMDCPALEEIPSGVGDIPTLQLIVLYKCRPSLEASVKEIQKVQQSEFGNYDLYIDIVH